MFLAWIYIVLLSHTHQPCNRERYMLKGSFAAWAEHKFILEIVIQIVKIKNAEEIGHLIYIIGYSQSLFTLYFNNFYFNVIIFTGREPIIAIFFLVFVRLFLCSPIHPFKCLIIWNVTNRLTLDGNINTFYAHARIRGDPL